MNQIPEPQDPSDTRRLLTAVGLSIAVMLVWTWLFPPPPPPPPTSGDGSTAASVATPATPTGASPASVAAASADALRDVAEETKTLVASSGHELVVTNRDGQVQAWDLTEAQYRKASGPDARALRMVEPPSAGQQRGVFLPPRVELSLDGKETALPYALSVDGESVVARARDSASGVEIERVFKPGAAPYTFEVTLRLRNSSARAVPYEVGALLRGAQKDSEASTGLLALFAPPVHLFEGVCQTAESLERQTLDVVASNVASDDASDKPTFSNGVRWAGVDNRYFLTAFVPDAQGIERCEYAVGGAAARVTPDQMTSEFRYLSTRVALPGGEVAAGQTVERTFTLYGGPKKLDALESMTPSLDAAVDFGWLSTLALPMLKVMQWFYGLLPNWGVAIILLTVLVKLLTLPLTVSQNRSMAGMKALAPKVEEIKKRYPSEPMRANQEVMELYKANGVNPLSGCLPMLLMMPVYFALYKTIYSAVELYHAELGGWITDLSAADPYFVLPLVLGAAMFVQTRMTPSGGDPVQQKIMQTFMPVLFTAMMLFLPSGLVVYILANTLLGILQQHYQNGLAAAAPKVEVVDGVGRRG